MSNKTAILDILQDIKNYVPVRCRADPGCDFDLKKVHRIIDDYMKDMRS
jgi:hypothetical protein